MGRLKALPEFQGITIEELKQKPMCILLQAGSNILTKWAMNNLYGFPYTPPFTHALMHLIHGDCMDVGLTTYIKPIGDVVKKSHRYIVIELTDLNDAQKTIGLSKAMHMAGGKGQKFKFYDVWGYLAFGLRKLGIKAKGSKRYPFCSDACIDVLQAMCYEYVMNVDSEKTSPCDLFMIFSKHQHAMFYELSTE